MGRESFASREDKKMGGLKAKEKVAQGEKMVPGETKRPSKFVPIEEVASDALSMEDQIEKRLTESIEEEDEKLKGLQQTLKELRRETKPEMKSDEKLKNQIKVNGLDISSAVSGGVAHMKERRLEDTQHIKMSAEKGKQHDSRRETRISKIRRADKKASPKRESR